MSVGTVIVIVFSSKLSVDKSFPFVVNINGAKNRNLGNGRTQSAKINPKTNENNNKMCLNALESLRFTVD